MSHMLILEFVVISRLIVPEYRLSIFHGESIIPCTSFVVLKNIQINNLIY